MGNDSIRSGEIGIFGLHDSGVVEIIDVVDPSSGVSGNDEVYVPGGDCALNGDGVKPLGNADAKGTKYQHQCNYQNRDPSHMQVILLSLFL